VNVRTQGDLKKQIETKWGSSIQKRIVPVLKQTIVFRGFSIISGIGIADLQTLEGSDIESAATNSNGPDKGGERRQWEGYVAGCHGRHFGAVMVVRSVLQRVPGIMT
jgi:hypothetical protein